MIQIAFLHHSRNYYPYLIQEISKLSSCIKDNIHLNILTSQDIMLGKLDFSYDIVKFPAGLNYLQKLHYAASQSFFEYTVKFDDDILITSENLQQLLNTDLLGNALCITPCLSTGIPTVDYFVEQTLNTQQQQIYQQMCCDTLVDKAGVWPGYTGQEYLKLNYPKEKWDYQEFYNKVESLDVHYKGIHPVRINPEIQKYINNCLLDKSPVQKIHKTRTACITTMPGPYLCNSCFMIKTSIWNEILQDRNLYVDAFDEVPLNRYGQNNHIPILVNRGCLAIHPYYNNVTDHQALGHQFYEKYICL